MQKQQQFIAVSRSVGHSSEQLTIDDFLMLIPSKDGTSRGISIYGVWSGIARSFKRYSQRYSADIELQGPSPEYSDALLSLVSENDRIPDQLKKLLLKVDAITEKSVLEFIKEKKNCMPIQIWKDEKIAKFLEHHAATEHRQLYNALV